MPLHPLHPLPLTCTLPPHYRIQIRLPTPDGHRTAPRAGVSACGAWHVLLGGLPLMAPPPHVSEFGGPYGPVAAHLRRCAGLGLALAAVHFHALLDAAQGVQRLDPKEVVANTMAL